MVLQSPWQRYGYPVHLGQCSSKYFLNQHDLRHDFFHRSNLVVFWSNLKHRRYNRYCIRPVPLHRQITIVLTHHTVSINIPSGNSKSVLDRSICWLCTIRCLSGLTTNWPFNFAIKSRKAGHFFERLDAFAIEPFPDEAARNFFRRFLPPNQSYLAVKL